MLKVVIKIYTFKIYLCLFNEFIQKKWKKVGFPN
jgi:hypothetical protein